MSKRARPPTAIPGHSTMNVTTNTARRAPAPGGERRRVRFDEGANQVREVPAFSPSRVSVRPQDMSMGGLEEMMRNEDDMATMRDVVMMRTVSPGKRARDLAREVGTLGPGSPPAHTAWRENPQKKEMDARWLGDLQQYLADFLSMFIESDDVVDSLLTSDAMGTWARAFTHETYDADFNYEELEMVGDRLLEPAFTLYMFQRFGQTTRLTSQILTEVKNRYMSKVYQARKSHFYGFDRYLRIPSTVSVNISTREDVYESFCGALFTTAEKIGSRESGVSSGLGFNLVRDFLRWDLDQETIDIESSQMNSITFVLQGLRHLGLMTDTTTFERWVPDPTSTTGAGTMTLELTPDAVRRARDVYGVHLNRVLASARGDTKLVARAAAYERARAELERNHIDYQVVQDIRKKRLWEQQDPVLAQSAQDKATDLGYSYIELDIQRSASRHGQVHAVVYGFYTKPVTSSGMKRVILTSANGPESEALSLALSEFVSPSWRGPESERWVWTPPEELPYEAAFGVN